MDKDEEIVKRKHLKSLADLIMKKVSDAIASECQAIRDENREAFQEIQQEIENVRLEIDSLEKKFRAKPAKIDEIFTRKYKKQDGDERSEAKE